MINIIYVNKIDLNKIYSVIWVKMKFNTTLIMIILTLV